MTNDICLSIGTSLSMKHPPFFRRELGEFAGTRHLAALTLGRHEMDLTM